MNRILSINISGTVFQIEEDAYDMLRTYMEKLKFHFRDNDGSQEIVDDIESRIAEMFTTDPGKHTFISKRHVEKVMEIMGSPSQFGDKEHSEFVPSARPAYRRLFRDPEGRILGGVCSGLGAYFNTDPLWVRILFLIAFFGFGSGLLVYLILWVIVPEAKTAADRLEMRGERVTIDNIERSIREEFERVKKKFH